MKDNIKKLEELFNDLSDITPEKMETLVKESVKAFEQILLQLNSGDEKQRKEAQGVAEKLRDTLEKHSFKALEAINMNAKELEAFTNNPDNFSPEEWEAMQKAKNELESYQKEMMEKGFLPSSSKEEENHGAAKKKKTLWIPS